MTPTLKLNPFKLQKALAAKQLEIETLNKQLSGQSKIDADNEALSAIGTKSLAIESGEMKETFDDLFKQMMNLKGKALAEFYQKHKAVILTGAMTSKKKKTVNN